MHKRGGAKCCKCHGGRGRWGTSCYDSPENCCKKRNMTKRSTKKRSMTKKNKKTRKAKRSTRKRSTKKLFFGLF